MALSADFVLPSDARCLDCGYLLNGLQQCRCPECGKAFDPSNLDSVRLPWMEFGLIGALRRRVTRPLNRRTKALPWIGFSLAIWAARVPDHDSFLMALAAWLWIGVVAGYGVPLLIRVALFRFGALPASAISLDRRFERTVVVLLAIAISSIAMKVPMHLAYYASRPALNRFTAQVASEPLGINHRRVWVGLYDGVVVLKDGHGFTILLPGASFTYRHDPSPCTGMFSPPFDLPCGWTVEGPLPPPDAPVLQSHAEP